LHQNNIKLHLRYTHSTTETRCHAIAGTTARCAQYMSNQKIMEAQNQPMIAQKSPHYNLITIRRWNYFRRIPTYVIMIPKRHGRSDGQTTCSLITALCVASRGISVTTLSN